jgi:hypothetical protein
MQRYIDQAAKATELAILNEALESLAVADSDTYGKIKTIKGHFVTDANVEMYVDFEHKTALLNMKKNPKGGEWEALFDAANGLESRVRTQRRQLARSWIRLEH